MEPPRFRFGPKRWTLVLFTVLMGTGSAIWFIAPDVNGPGAVPGTALLLVAALGAYGLYLTSRTPKYIELHDDALVIQTYWFGTDRTIPYASIERVFTGWYSWYRVIIIHADRSYRIASFAMTGRAEFEALFQALNERVPRSQEPYKAAPRVNRS